MVEKFNNCIEYRALKSATRTALAAFTMLLTTTVFPSTPSAAPTDPPEQKSTEKSALPAPVLTGLEALKAQMNALNGGLENLRRLRDFFDKTTTAEEGILTRAQQLIGTLPQHENAGDAAWRIAAVASLTLESGGLADIDVDNGYRLARGAVGWDLGPEGSKVHAGFTPVTPEAIDANRDATAIQGTTALTDGITDVKGFEATLPNGLYRVMIVRDSATDVDPLESPFGGEINLNGSPIKSIAGGNRERVKLTGGGEKIVSSEPTAPRDTALGLGIEGWAIVENGKLRIDFEGLPEGRAISAIIAEPFEIDKVDLNPVVMDTLADSLGDIEPAAGPEGRSTRPVLRFNGAGNRTPKTATASKGANGNGGQGAGASAGTSTGGGSNSRASFASTRTAARSTAGETEDAGAPQAATTPENDTPAFEDRQLLVKRSISEGSDSEGLAIDLGKLLDDASLSGVFMCLSEPCEDTAPIAPEPDLTAAAEALGDWLGNPENLPEDWEDLISVLAGRSDGSEVAIVYEFEIGTDSWTDVELRLNTGSGLFVWLDGEYIFGASENGAFIDDLDFEYSILLPDLAGGQHFLQILSEDHTSDQGFAFELRGTPVTNTSKTTAPVPEPGTLALFGLGLIGLCSLRRRARAING